MGYRGIYHNGWYACTTPPITPWSPVLGVTLPDVITGYTWELYNLDEDYSQYNDLAAKNPDKLKELQDVFTREAWKYNIFPLNSEVFKRGLEPRPNPVAGRTEFTYTGVISGISDASAPPLLGRSYTITAEIEVPQGGAQGMIVTNGGQASGYGLYLVKGAPVFTYNLLDLERFRWAAKVPLAPGKHTIVFDFTYDGPGIAKGGTGVLKVDGATAATLAIPRTLPFTMPVDETFDVGIDTRTGVNNADYQVPFPFTGTITKVTFKIGPSQLTSEDHRVAAKAVAAARD